MTSARSAGLISSLLPLTAVIVNRCSQETALVADLPDLHAWDAGELEDQEACIASVEQA